MLVEKNLIKQDLISKLENHSAIIGIIGLGYVGLPLSKAYISQRYKVIGFDIDNSKIEYISRGESYIEHVDIADLKAAFDKGDFIPTTDFVRISEVDAIILCVPTPLNSHREPDLTFVLSSLESVLPWLKKGQVLSLESTTYPGTTEEELRPRIEQQGLTIGKDFFLIYSPEREDPNNPKYTTQSIPKVCGGTTHSCFEVGKALYGKVIEEIIEVSSTQAAEMSKILENTFRAVNIALVNELKLVAEKMGVDIFEVIRAASPKPFGFMPFYPGPGLGGHCIPIDPFYLTWKAREYGISTKFIELAGEVNVSMPKYVITKVMEALNVKGKAISGSKILVLGIAYKKNVDDMRESPSAELLKILQGMGAEIAYSDPHVPAFKKMRKYKFDLTSINLSEDSLKRFDCAIIATDHDKFDWSLIKEHSSLIIDTRGVYDMDNVKIFRG